MPDDKVTAVLEQNKRILALAKDEWERNRRWNLWQDIEVKKSYPELESSVLEIARFLSLKENILDLEMVKRIFPDDMPDGAFPKIYDKRTDREKRCGVYVGFQVGEAIIVVHTFYKNRKRDWPCWRARAFRNANSNIIEMPPKESYRGGSKPHIWCESLRGCFISDLMTMINQLQ